MSARQWLLVLLLANALPIAGLCYAAWRVARGDAEWSQLLPPGLKANGPYLCAALVFLCMCVWLLLPASLAGARAVARALARSRELRREGGCFRRLWEALLWPARQLLFWLFYLARGASFIASFAALALVGVYLARIFFPDLLSAWLPFPENLFDLRRRA